MAVEQPAAGDPLNAPSHSALHRVIAASVSATVQSIGVDDNSNVTLKNKTQSLQPTSPINNTPYAAIFDEATTNLITNPSFEVDTSGWSTYGSNSTITRITSDKYVGDACLQIAVTPATASSGAVTSSISTTVSKTYIFSFWAKGNAGSEAITASIVGSNSGATSTAYTLTTTWRRFFCIKTLNGSDTSCTIRVFTTNASAHTWFIDAVQFEQKDNTAYQDTFPTSYCDGSLGAGHSWSGTAHASTSSRVAGFHVLGPITSHSAKGFVIKTDGTIGASHIHLSPDLADLNTGNFGAGYQNNATLRTPFLIKGYVPLTAVLYGNSGGLVGIHNTANGPGLYVKSDTTTDGVLVVDGGSVTSGSLIAVYAPSDLSNFTGSFLAFADKSGAASYDFKRNAFKIGVANLNQYHYLQGLGAGSIASTSTTKTNTISSSGTTVTGSSTAFTTDYIVGDIIVASGQKRYITAIASNTSLTTHTAFNPVISAGTAHAKANAQYYPFFITMDVPGGDHEVLDFTGKVNSIFLASTERPKLLRQTESAGTGTISSSGTTVTGVGTSFTTELSVGDIIIADGQRLVVIAIASNTSLTTKTAASPAWSADNFTYINTTTSTQNPDITTSRNEANAPVPTADTDGVYYVMEQFKDTASKTTTSNTSEQSIFTTTPTIAGGRMGASGTLEINAFGTLAAAGATKTLTFRVKLGSTTILTTHAETIAETNAMNWVMKIIIQNTATNAQKTSFQFWPIRQNTSNSTAVDPIIDYETAAVDTTIDQTLDITAQYGTVSSTITKESIIAKIW